MEVIRLKILKHFEKIVLCLFTIVYIAYAKQCNADSSTTNTGNDVQHCNL